MKRINRKETKHEQIHKKKYEEDKPRGINENCEKKTQLETPEGNKLKGRKPKT